jgi:glycosyltransferase involved in cell wall biosynthesis
MSAAPVKVLFAIPSLDRDGPDRVMFEILTALDRGRFAPSLLVSEPVGHYLERLPADIPIEVLGPQRSLRGRYPVVRALRVVRAHAPAIVFSTLRMNLTLGLAAPGFPSGTRLVIRQANDFTTDFSRLVRRSLMKHRVARALSLAVLRRADAIVCQSDAMRADLRRLLGDASPLHTIGNPIDVDAATRAAAASTVKLPGAPALVSVGRLAPQKGFDVLLEAVAEIRPRFPRLHLTILGDGPDRAELVRLRQRLGLDSSVTLAGFSSQVLASVAVADLFVLASRYEGFPNAALEALACGTPVVLTDCPGANATLVEPGRNGRLAAAVSPPAVASALVAALDEVASYDRAAISARTRERFSARRIVGQYEQLFAAVAATGRAAA